MSITADQIKLVQSAWGKVRPDLTGNGLIVFEKALQNDDLRSIYKFLKGHSGPVREHPELPRHVTKVMTKLDEVLEQLATTDRMMDTLSILGNAHKPYGVIPGKHVQPVGDGLMLMLRTVLGDGFTADVEAAWAVAWNIIVTKLFE